MFVNRRAIQPRGPLAIIVTEAYHTLLMKGRHPLVVLDIRVPPGTVDVNVHPTKSEVKFQFQARVNGVLGRAVRTALLEGADVQPWVDATPSTESVQRRFELRQVGHAPTGGPAEATAAWKVGSGAWDTRHSRWDAGGAEMMTPQDTPVEHAADAVQTRPTAEQERELGAAMVAPVPASRITPTTLPPLRVVGQVGLTYVVAEAPEGMYLIDQHAAHERITYERLMAQHGSGAVEAQGLLLPQTVTLPPAAAGLLLNNATALAEWGFALDSWGEGMVRLRGVPATLPIEDVQAALLEIADALAGRGGSTPTDWREAMLTTLSCHTSVRAGQALSLEEMRKLLQQLEHCTSPRTCPHGRPTMVLLTPGQLERQFGRQV